MENEVPSYHDVHVTTAKLERTSIFNLPYGYELTCNRVGGWSLWKIHVDVFTSHKKLAGEFDTKGLIIDVDGHVICDSLTKKEK